MGIKIKICNTKSILHRFGSDSQNLDYFSTYKPAYDRMCILELEYQCINYIMIISKKKKNDRSSHPEVFLGKGVLKIWSKFTGEHPCRSVISVKLQSNFIEITLWHGCSPINLLHILRTPFPRNTSGWPLIKSCWKVVDAYHFMLDCVRSNKNEDMCKKAVSEEPFTLKNCLDKHNSQEICDKVVDACLLLSKFVPY